MSKFVNKHKLPIKEKSYQVKVTTYKTVNKLGEPIKTQKLIKTVIVWSKKAIEKQEKYHETKNGKTYLRLPIQSKPKPSKEELLALRPFSEYHYKLINKAYSQESKSMRILKKCAENDKHLIDIENMSAKLKAYKSRLKLRNPKNMLYRLEIYYSNSKHEIKTILVRYVNSIPEVNYLANLNRHLSKYPNYHHLSIKDKKDNVLLIMVNCNY